MLRARRYTNRSTAYAMRVVTPLSLNAPAATAASGIKSLMWKNTGPPLTRPSSQPVIPSWSGGEITTTRSQRRTLRPPRNDETAKDMSNRIRLSTLLGSSGTYKYVRNTGTP